MPMDFLFPLPEPVNWALLLAAVAVQAPTLSLLLRLERESIRQRSSSEADMNATAPAGGPGGLSIRALVLSGLSLLALVLEIRFSSLDTVWNAAVFAWMVVVVGAIGWFFCTGWTARYRMIRGTIIWAILGTVVVCAINSFGNSLGLMNPRPLLEMLVSDAHISDLKFSPDGLTLAVAEARGETDIIRVADGTLLQKLPGGPLRCAWNFDGSLLAVARDNWPDIEIWDVPTWTLKRRLTLFDAGRAKVSPYLAQLGEKPRPKSENACGLVCTCLCFDPHGNLFVVEWSLFSEEHPTAFPYEIPRAVVFWKAADGWTEIPEVDLSLSVARLGETTRYAYRDGSGHIDLWRIEKSPSGANKLRREYGITDCILTPSVGLSSEAKYLLASDQKSACLFELFDDHAKLIHSQEHVHFGAGAPVRGCVFSRNGRFAAYHSEGRVTVVRIPSFQTALTIDASASFDLSPDGRLLATGEFRRGATRLYEVPQ